MKRAFVAFILILAVIGAGVLWKRSHRGDAKATEEKPPAVESRLTHDEKGRVVIKMDDETQGNLGLLVAKPAAAQQNPELKGYGRVLDPAALASLVTELASVQAAWMASSNELTRLKALVKQQNASERAVQTGEAAALRDQLAVQSAKDRLALSWGKAIAEQTNLPAFIQPLASQNAVLVRIDLPMGETLATPPRGARISTLSGKAVEAEFMGTTSSVDPVTLGRGAIFIIRPNVLGLMSGEAVIGYLLLAGEPVAGVNIPSEAVVRAEGRGWIYIMNSGGDAFTRTEIPLDHPAPAGWFISQGVSTNDYVVVTGAQTLLSEELKSSIKAD